MAKVSELDEENIVRLAPSPGEIINEVPTIGMNIEYNVVAKQNIAFARGGAHLPIAHALRLLSTNEIEIEKK